MEEGALRNLSRIADALESVAETLKSTQTNAKTNNLDSSTEEALQTKVLLMEAHQEGFVAGQNVGRTTIHNQIVQWIEDRLSATHDLLEEETDKVRGAVVTELTTVLEYLEKLS